ncbi:hypothetical protein J6590_030709 [Homalodisca vitripennis]|nr:hypothetical protein J6590_030709 [Homalodisca vitripennis]
MGHYNKHSLKLVTRPCMLTVVPLMKKTADVNGGRQFLTTWVVNNKHSLKLVKQPFLTLVTKTADVNEGRQFLTTWVVNNKHPLKLVK